MLKHAAPQARLATEVTHTHPEAIAVGVAAALTAREEAREPLPTWMGLPGIVA